MPTLVQLREEYTAQAKKMHDIVSAAEKDSRGLTDAEKTDFKSLTDACDNLRSRIEFQDQIENSSHLAALEAQDREHGDRERHAENGRSFDGGDPNRPLSTAERSRGLTAWALGRKGSADARDAKLAERMGIWERDQIELTFRRGASESGEQFQAPKSIREAIKQADSRSRQRAEQRATQLVGTANVGGNNVPDEMMRPLEVNLLAYGGMRKTSTVISTATGAKLPMPTANDVANEGIEVAEDSVVAEQTVAFGQLTLSAYKYSSRMIPISVELMQDAATNMPAFLGGIIGERLGRITNRRFTTGTGTAQPRGIVTDAANSAVTQASGTSLAFAEVLRLLHSVDPAYRELGAGFMMADSTALLIKLMSDTQGRPLWLPSLIAGEPDTFAGYPYCINQHMPTGTGAKGVIFGALSKYLIREVLGITLIRLDERYAEYHRVAFLAFMRCDGRLTDAGTAPVKYLTLA